MKLYNFKTYKVLPMLIKKKVRLTVLIFLAGKENV